MALSGLHGNGVIAPTCCFSAWRATRLHSLSHAAAAATRITAASHQCSVGRRDCLRRNLVASAAPRWNPQNVDNPVTVPNVALSAEEAVEVQLEALRQNDSPWSNHGVQTMYEFGEGIGNLDPAWYFGYPKDNYHQDHFFGMFANTFPQLINADSWEVTATKEVDDKRTIVEAAVVAPGGGSSCSVTFALRRKTAGNNQGAWLTRMLLHGNIAQAMAHIEGLVTR